jgi:hypothetical protein
METNCHKCGEMLNDWYCCQDCETKAAESNGRFLMAQEVLKWIKENSSYDEDIGERMLYASDLEIFVKGLL